MEVTVVIAQAPFIVPVPSVGAPGTRHHGPHGSDRGPFGPAAHPWLVEGTRELSGRWARRGCGVVGLRRSHTAASR